MGKSLKNAVTPDDIYASYGADTLRVYEMAMGPLDASRPWRSDDIVGAHRLLQRTWRAIIDEETGEVVVDRRADRRRDPPRPAPHDRRGHRGLRGAALQHGGRADHRTGQPHHQDRRVRARDGRDPGAAVGAAGAAHRRGDVAAPGPRAARSASSSFPVADPAELVDDTVTLVVQVNGKVRDRIEVATDADAATIEAAALALPRIVELMDGADAAQGDQPPADAGQHRPLGRSGSLPST